MKSWHKVRIAVFLGTLGLVLGLGGGVTYAAFFATTSNTGNTISTADDLTAPAITSVIQGQAGDDDDESWLGGRVRQGRPYFVYANVADTGNPASGVDAHTIEADVHHVTSGVTSWPLRPAGGPWMVEGVRYEYRGAELTADQPLPAGTRTYTVSAADRAGNGTTTPFTVIVDNSGPEGADIQTANGGDAVGMAEAADTITFTYSEPVEPSSILPGWSDPTEAVTVRVRLANASCGVDDAVTILSADGSQTLPLGKVCLGRKDYVNGNRFFPGSTMTLQGNSVVVTLGTLESLTVETAEGNGTMTWLPDSTVTDGAGNHASGDPVTERGPDDPEF